MAEELGFEFGDVYLSRADFNGSLLDWVAFTVGFAGNVSCVDKTAALELLRHQAAEIIKRVRTEP